MIGSVAGWEEGDFRELIQRFHSYYPGIRIRLDIDTRGEGQHQRLRVRGASGEWIDVAHIVGPHLMFMYMLTPLNDFAKADKSFYSGAYYTRLVNYYNTPDDRLWCLPWSYATEALYYNSQHFAEADIPYPDHNWTWDDFSHAARLLTRHADDSDVPNSWGAEFQLHNLDYLLRSFGGGFRIGEAENPEETRAGNVAALQFLADLVLKERVHPFPGLGLNGGFAQGKVSMAFLPEQVAAKLNAVKNLEYDVAPIPQGPAGSVTSCASSGVAMGGEFWGNTCPHPDHAWEVIKWFAHADSGEWDIARTFLIPKGIPIALRAANEYCWTRYHEKPESRHLFLQSFETAMVPFSDSPWWPYLSEYGRTKWNPWEEIKRVFGGWGQRSVEEVVRVLEDDWRAEWAVIAKEMSDYSAGSRNCYGR